MVAVWGNQNNKRLDTPELRQLAYKSYCDHIAAGKSKKSWFLEEPVTLTWETMEKYIKNDPGEFDPDQKKQAEAKGFGIWESVVEDSAKGANKDANVAALQMLMRNKYKWDRRDQVFDEESSGDLLNVHENLINQLTRHQKGNLLDVSPGSSN